MKRFLLFVVALGVTMGVMASAQVKVTFVANTATIADTFSAGSKLTVTGNLAAITGWGAGVDMTNIGGDYWSTEVTFAAGDTVKFKFRANGGWESNLENPHGAGVATNDRVLIVGSADTTLPVQFYNGTTSKQLQYWKPWGTTGSDSLTVWFRVNMQAVMENKSFSWTDADVDSVVIMGDNVGATSDLDWGTSHFLKQESNPNFFSGRVRFAKSNVTEGKVVNYKYRLGIIWGRDELQGQSNRTFGIPVGFSDTTLYYVYYNNDEPTVQDNKDTVIVTFSVDLSKTSLSGGFSQGDTIVVQSGFFNTAAENGRQKQLDLLIGSAYEVTDTVVTSVNGKLDYQYYLLKNNTLIRENYFNHYYTGTVSSERERRQITVPSKEFIIADIKTSATDPRRQPEFTSQKPLGQQVKVKWVVNLKPAYRKVAAGGSILDEQGDATVQHLDSIKVWGVGINGPATNVPDITPVGDWATWNRDMVADTSKRKMWDDGTHGDVTANDTLYTVEITYAAGATAGRVYKFGIRGGDNEGGNGKAFGNNHSANISDVNPTYEIYTEFGSINPVYYSEWFVNAVGHEVNSSPEVFALNQNYPNPFNPATTIKFSVPARSDVRMTVYNVVGQQVATLVNETLEKGNHYVSFNASNLASGIYFYKLTAGNFTSVKKMMLLK